MKNNTLISPQEIIEVKKCKVCGLSPMKNSEFCYRHNPNYKKDILPSFNEITTVAGVQRSYCALLNALKKGKIKREDGQVLIYGLNSFIKALKDIVDIKTELDSQINNKPVISDSKIEELKELVSKLDNLNKKFKHTYNPTGEIAQVEEIEKNAI